MKRHHLGSQRNLRPDDLVHLLQGAVDVDFQQKLYQITEGFVDPPLSTYDAKRKKRATSLDFTVAGLMVKLLVLELKVHPTVIYFDLKYQWSRAYANFSYFTFPSSSLRSNRLLKRIICTLSAPTSISRASCHVLAPIIVDTKYPASICTWCRDFTKV